MKTQTLDRPIRNYQIISPVDLAERMVQLRNGEQIEFYLDDLQHMDDYRMPEQKHYVTITCIDEYPNVIAGKDAGGFTFIKNIEDYVNSPWGFNKFLHDYLAAYNERFGDHICRIFIDCTQETKQAKHQRMMFNLFRKH